MGCFNATFGGGCGNIISPGDLYVIAFICAMVLVLFFLPRPDMGSYK